ncbi:Flagellar hook-basal body complex protein FliE [Lacunisphaera limnophila]|uniref:Flagellar hook-basal body complex protein FliE n=1 Tax=Lacunisphaera limnophila TaxID=1838286 RepID=A0A1D8AW57_9BACT|nr:flagellar hook-basal body complex protein FliE [Lacunisphaera limnophila]AOS45106.1 Flagellar hook-basal body complex protein FliE [Lacunisphaera limnophila]
MSPIGSTSALSAFPLQPLDVAQTGARIAAPLPDGMRLAAPTESFGNMLDGLVSTVAEKQAASANLTKSVLLGDSDQLHQSVIAMQEASVAFTLMVEVRNKLVESYQELMRMQV